jgi:hypothetical protein
MGVVHVAVVLKLVPKLAGGNGCYRTRPVSE